MSIEHLTEGKTTTQRMAEWLALYELAPAGGYIPDMEDETPGTGAICPAGREALWKRDSIAGGAKIRWRSRWKVSYTLAETQQGLGIAWAEGLERWAASMSAAGLVPHFGDTNTQGDVVRAERGRMEKRPDTGAVRYCVEVTAEYQTNYKHE